VLVHDDAAHVLAVEQVVVALVDLVEGVRPGDELVELDVARLEPRVLRMSAAWFSAARSAS
jgi:hypothetical protein